MLFAQQSKGKLLPMASSQPWILGLSASFHNGAATLLHGSEVVVSIQEERLSRLKHDHIQLDQQMLCVQYCLDAAGITAADLSLIVVSQLSSPFDRRRKLFNRNPLFKSLNVPVQYISHHLGHAVSAFATSGFDEAITLVVDGGGSYPHELTDEELLTVKATVYDESKELWRPSFVSPSDADVIRAGCPTYAESVSLYYCSLDKIKPLEKYVYEPNYLMTLGKTPGMPEFRSLGHMFNSAALQIFGNYTESGKVMGLAAYGEKTIKQEELVQFDQGNLSFSNSVPKRFTNARRWPERRADYENLAASVQGALENTLLDITRHAYNLCRLPQLCYTGGVALNSVANERLLREGPFDKLHIVPASDDAGPALGAAFYGLCHLQDRIPVNRAKTDSLGKRYQNIDIDAALQKLPNLRVVETNCDALSTTVELLCDKKIVGWFQDGSEFGPRALGYRSILCDPRLKDGQSYVNSQVKFREAFRPFAPAILKEELTNWFEDPLYNPAMDFMLRVCKFKEDQAHRVPAVVHHDGTGRLQSVTKKSNPKFYNLIKAFGDRTGVPIILNTSFNTMGEPIVESPFDALLCLLTTGLDYCVINDVIVEKVDPDWSILDATPEVIGQVLMEQPDYAVPEPTMYRSYLVETKYGKKMHAVPAEQARVLNYLDGTTTGFDVIEAIKHSGNIISERALQRMLVSLCSLSLINISANGMKRSAR